MSEPSDASRGVLLQILTTEEFVLQSTRTGTISESSSRTTIFLSSVASGLIAIALTAQLSRIGHSFYVLALTVMPTLVLLGMFSYARVIQTGIEDFACALKIERIRSHYAMVEPEYAAVMRAALSGTTTRDAVAHSTSARWQLLLTGATMVSGVTSVLVGATAGLVSSAVGSSLLAATAIAIPLGAASFALLLADQRRRWIDASATLMTRSPLTEQ